MKHVYQHPTPFKLKRGGVLPRFELAWEDWGELNATRDNAVVIFTGLSPGAHAAKSADDPSAGWWEYMVGHGKPVDTDRWYVICANSLGSCKGSTGPASIDPKTGRPYAMGFPDLSIEDIARSTALLLDSLDLASLACVIGPSMGGMSAQAFCALHPGRARHMVSISSAPRALPWAIAIRSLQREAIRRDPDFAGGAYHDSERWPTMGMQLARKLGMLSYRSAKEWEERFGRQRMEQTAPRAFAPEFEIESYLQAHAERFTRQFDPVSYIYLSRAMDWFDIDQVVRDPYQAMALNSALVLGVSTDMLFPLHQQRQIADACASAGASTAFHELASIQGHDAFLVDEARFAPAVAQYMEGLE